MFQLKDLIPGFQSTRDQVLQLLRSPCVSESRATCDDDLPLLFDPYLFAQKHNALIWAFHKPYGVAMTDHLVRDSVQSGKTAVNRS
jgi:hypothetical protein